MKGPIPKPLKLRQRRNKVSTAAVLETEAEAAEREVPPLPKMGKWHPMVVEWWNAVWTSPIAGEFLEVDKQRLYKIAVLHHEFWKSTNNPKAQMALAAEIRMQEAPMGLSPVDRRRLQWEVAKGEEAEAKTGRIRRNKRLAALSKTDPRKIFRVVK